MRANPGDLITAEFINQILERLDALETVTTTGEGVSITSLFPDVPVCAKDRLLINGRNFAPAAADNEVTVGGFTAEILNAAETQLLIEIPANIEIPDFELPHDGITVTLAVTNSNGTATHPLVLIPADGVAITSLVPAGPVRVGDALIVNGRNFAVPATDNKVTVGGIPVPGANFQSTSSGMEERQLIFKIPSVSGLHQEGTAVMIAVENENRSAAHPLILKDRIVMITSLDPEGPLRAGDEVVINGRNFTGDDEVYISGLSSLPLTVRHAKSGEECTQLSFKIDDMGGITTPDARPEGTAVMFEVKNANGNAFFTIVLKPDLDAS